MGNKAKILPNYTYDDYIQWEGRWEIIDGIPYAMSPMPSPRHQELSGKIHRELLNALGENSCNCQVYQPIDVKISEHTVVNPDLLIVCQPIEGQYLDTPPELVVEILSPSTRLKDLNSKYDLYQNFDIPYYVIVDPENNSITVYRRNDKGEYKEQEGYAFELSDNCNISADLDCIWN